MRKTLAFLFSVLLLSSCHRNGANPEGNAVLVSDYDGLSSTAPPNTASVDINRTSLSKDEYIAWIRDTDNGLHQTEKIDDLTFSVFYKPLDYVVLQELASARTSIDSFQTFTEQYEGLQYFTLSIKSDRSQDILKHNIRNDQDYYNRIDYFSFRMQSDIQLIEGNDTLACRIFHYERTYQVAPYTNFVLAFEDTRYAGSFPARHDKTLVLHDQAFGKGIVKVKLKAKDINKIPQLVIN